MQILKLLSRAAIVCTLPALLTGCSMALALGAVQDTSGVLSPGTKRADVIAALGPPRKSIIRVSPRALTAPPVAWPSAKVTLCDEYRVSGLVLTPDEYGRYDNQWGVYPIALILTAGASEIIALPVTVGDVTRRAFQRHDLRLWYDRTEKLVRFDKR